MELQFTATVIYWRGPAPFFYARIPAAIGAEIAKVKKAASYGWGVIPVEATINGVTFTTSLFPKDDTYLLPLKDAVRQPLGITAGDEVVVDMTVLGTSPRMTHVRVAPARLLSARNWAAPLSPRQMSFSGFPALGACRWSRGPAGKRPLGEAESAAPSIKAPGRDVETIQGGRATRPRGRLAKDADMLHKACPRRLFGGRHTHRMRA